MPLPAPGLIAYGHARQVTPMPIDRHGRNWSQLNCPADSTDCIACIVLGIALMAVAFFALLRLILLPIITLPYLLLLQFVPARKRHRPPDEPGTPPEPCPVTSNVPTSNQDPARQGSCRNS